MDVGQLVVCKCPVCTKNGHTEGKMWSQRTVDRHAKEAAKLKRAEVRAQDGMSRENSKEESDAKNSPLYPGSILTVLQAVTMLLSVQGLFPGVSKAGQFFVRLVTILQG